MEILAEAILVVSVCTGFVGIVSVIRLAAMSKTQIQMWARKFNG